MPTTIYADARTVVNRMSDKSDIGSGERLDHPPIGLAHKPKTAFV
jgi:hypothetical protein